MSEATCWYSKINDNTPQLLFVKKCLFTEWLQSLVLFLLDLFRIPSSCS